jgi:RNA polymerase sigma factor for flagellar operon FliA
MDTHQLIIDALPLAGNIAGNIAKRLPPHVDPRDLRQDACTGLVDAATRYDVTKGVPFGAFARRRVRGAVMDGLRRQDHISRQARRQINAEGAEVPLQAIQLINPDQVIGVVVAPDGYAAQTECKRLMAEAVEALPARKRLLIRGHYFGGKSLREIGVELGVKSARASQLHAQTLGELRKSLEMRGVTCLREVRL